MSTMDEVTGAAAAEAIDEIQTTSVDGRTYASIEDLLSLVHAMQATVESVALVNVAKAADEVTALVVIERAYGLAVGYNLFDTTLHALADREGLEGLSPGDFL